MKGAELLGKHLKLFTDKVEHTGKDGGPIETRDYSDIEKARAIAHILTQGEHSLEKEICQSGAKVILGLGKWAQYTLRGKTSPIHDWCGSPYPVTSPFCESASAKAAKKKGKAAAKAD